MKKITFYSITLFILTCQLVFAQENKSNNTAKSYTIPFQLTSYNNMAIQAILNEKDTVQLMFHTAADALSLTEETTAKLRSLHWSGADSVQSWGGSENTSRSSKSNTLQIGALKWENVPIWENKNSGQQTDGKFGINLFEHKVIEIDFEKSIMVISTQLPKKVKRYEQAKLTLEHGYMLFEATAQLAGQAIKHPFLIHSGYSGSLLFDDGFVAANKIGEKLQVIDEKQLKDSFGNILKTKKAILPSLSIGKQKLVNVPVGFFEGALGRQKMSIVGGDILKRFNIIIDAQRTYVYFKANKLSTSAYANI